jgi:hypothetical protein
LSKQLRPIGSTVVRVQLPDRNAQALEVQKRSLEKGNCGCFRFIGKNFDVGRPGKVIDGDVGDLPSKPSMLPGSIASNPMANPLDPGEFLGIQMEKITWRLMLIPAGRLSFKEGRPTRKPIPSQDQTNRRPGQRETPGHIRRRQPRPPQIQHLGDHGWLSGPRDGFRA